MQHLIIGPGKFGLGFAGELAARVGWKSTLVLRGPRGDSQKGEIQERLLTRRCYRVKWFDKPDDDAVEVSGLQAVTVTDFSHPGEAILRAFTEPELCLISVAVGAQALRSVAPLIARGLQARKDSGLEAPTILTCVNLPENGTKFASEVRAEAGALWPYFKCAFPNCVVDRVCHDIRCERETVEISAEKYARLIVERPRRGSPSRAVGHLAERLPAEISLVRDVRPWEQAKLWGVNGLHLFLAAAAHRRCIAKNEVADWPNYELAKVLREDTFVRTYASLYVREVAAAVALSFPGETSQVEIERYLQEIISRLERGLDRAGRILRDIRLSTQTFDSEFRAAVDPRKPPHEQNREMIERLLALAVGDFLDKVRVRMLGPVEELWHRRGLIPAATLVATSYVLQTLSDERNLHASA